MIAAAATVAACASAPADDRNTDATPGTTNERTQIFGDASRIVGPDAVGVEAHWWLAEQTSRSIAHALAPHAANTQTNTPLAPSRDTWREDGFRVTIVPFEALDAIIAAVPPQREWQRKWLGRAERWDAVISGRSLAPTQPVLFDGRPVAPGAGTPRLLARAWPEPAFPDAAAMRIELAVQLERPGDSPRFALEAPTSLASQADQGPLFEGLTLSVAVPAGHAIAITAAPPTEDWTSIAQHAAQTTRTPPRPDIPQPETIATPSDAARALDQLIDQFEATNANNNPDDSATPNPLGPEPEPVRTLGETMLTLRTPSQRSLAAVIILIPRLPDTFQLLPVPRDEPAPANQR